ncbi:MAG: hypothetical protein KW802_01515 [Candidatus Doudnabacteria bacterium]|nr:hypothetical protein [Candidatus Doudnabacteria bacterium]
MKKQTGLFSKEELKLVPKKPGVYFVFINKHFSRLKGRTNIIYIGKANNLYKRLIRPRSALPRFTTLRANGFTLRFHLKTTKTIAQARQREVIELIKFEKEHLELPSLNRSS